MGKIQMLYLSNTKHTHTHTHMFSEYRLLSFVCMCDRVRGGFKLSVGVCRCVGMNGYGEVGRRVWLYPGTHYSVEPICRTATERKRSREI